jgi:hypothetical protein
MIDIMGIFSCSSPRDQTAENSFKRLDDFGCVDCMSGSKMQKFVKMYEDWVDTVFSWGDEACGAVGERLKLMPLATLFSDFYQLLSSYKM